MLLLQLVKAKKVVKNLFFEKKWNFICEIPMI